MISDQHHHRNFRKKPILHFEINNKKLSEHKKIHDIRCNDVKKTTFCRRQKCVNLLFVMQLLRTLNTISERNKTKYINSPEVLCSNKSYLFLHRYGIIQVYNEIQTEDIWQQSRCSNLSEIHIANNNILVLTLICIDLVFIISKRFFYVKNILSQQINNNSKNRITCIPSLFKTT